MPTLSIITNVPLVAPRPVEIAKKLSAAVAKSTGKPEAYVCVSLRCARSALAYVTVRLTAAPFIAFCKPQLQHAQFVRLCCVVCATVLCWSALLQALRGSRLRWHGRSRRPRHDGRHRGHGAEKRVAQRSAGCSPDGGAGHPQEPLLLPLPGRGRWALLLSRTPAFQSQRTQGRRESEEEYYYM